MRNSDQADHVNLPKSLPKTLLELYWKYVTVELGDSQLWGQSYKTFYTLGQIYKLALKLDNML